MYDYAEDSRLCPQSRFIPSLRRVPGVTKSVLELAQGEISRKNVQVSRHDGGRPIANITDGPVNRLYLPIDAVAIGLPCLVNCPVSQGVSGKVALAVAIYHQPELFITLVEK
jgi:hypothetical protein